MRVSRKWSPAVTGVLLVAAAALPARAGEVAAAGSKPTVRFGGGVTVAAPTGEFADHVDVAGGLSGYALFGRPAGILALRLDGGWLIYGEQTLSRPVPGTGGLVVEDVVTTDNWIAQIALGPQLMARSGRVRPYGNAFAGGSYFATTSELVRPRFDHRLFVVGSDPFRTTTHYDDFTWHYGGGAGMLIGLGSGHTALDIGVRYVANNPVRYLTDNDPVDGIPRRSEGHLIEFHIGVSGN